MFAGGERRTGSCLVLKLLLLLYGGESFCSLDFMVWVLLLLGLVPQL